MIIDRRAQIADSLNLGTTLARHLHGDQIDLGRSGVSGFGDLATPGDIGNSALAQALAIVVQITTAVTSGGATNVVFEVVTGDVAAIPTDGTATVHVQTEAIPKATLVAGYTRRLPLPPRDPAYRRYLGLMNVNSGTALTAGAASAFLIRDAGTWQALPDAV